MSRPPTLRPHSSSTGTAPVDSTALIARSIQRSAGPGPQGAERADAKYVIGLGLQAGATLTHARAADLVPERYQDLVARYRHHYLAASRR